MGTNAWKWLARHNGEVIKKTAIAAGTVIGLALLSGVTVEDELIVDCEPTDDMLDESGEVIEGETIEETTEA